MKEKGHLIKTVQPGSIAEEMEIEAGDRLLAINGEDVEDIFDYQYMICLLYTSFMRKTTETISM